MDVWFTYVESIENLNVSKPEKDSEEIRGGGDAKYILYLLAR
jgi:hypothetical protein